MLLKVLGIWALVPFRLKLRLRVWLILSMFTIQPSMLANYSFVELLIYWGFNCEQAEELGLLVTRLITEAFF